MSNVLNAAYDKSTNSIRARTTTKTQDTQLLTVSNTTGSIIPFRITGTVRIKALWGIVTTVLSANVTAAFWRVNDQTAQTNLTLATGTTLSAAPVGSMIFKKGLTATALVYTTSAAATLIESATASTPALQEFVVVGKPAVNNDLEFRYTTTDAPSTGAITFFVEWEALSSDGNIAAL